MFEELNITGTNSNVMTVYVIDDGNCVLTWTNYKEKGLSKELVNEFDTGDFGEELEYLSVYGWWEGSLVFFFGSIFL